MTLAAVSSAAAAPPRCGSTITQSTTLTANIGPCNQGGLVIGADNITLDLGGKTVMGKPRAGDYLGILVAGHTGVTIRNGIVRDFDAGVVIRGGSGNTVTQITARDNIGTLSGANSKAGRGDGITINGASNNTISGNTVVHNGPFGGITILAALDGSNISANNVIQGNNVVGNDVALDGVNQDDGIRIEGPNSPGTQIIGNTVRDSGLDGISIFADQGTGYKNSGTVITGNLIEGNGFHDKGHRKGDGIVLFGSPANPAIGGADNTLVTDNDVLGNAASGIRVASRNNTISSNTAQGNAAWPGLSNVFDLNDLNANCDNNVWLGNVFGTASSACIS
jgi:parallel beta-helix repeat protein